MASLLQQLPVATCKGLPAIQPNLEWSRGSRVYVLGAYASLQLGPGALNLAGARTGSVLVVDHLRKVAAAEGWMQELVDLHKKQLV